MQTLKQLNKKHIYDRLHLYVFLIVLVAISFKVKYFFIFTIIYSLFLVIKMSNKYIFFLVILIISLYFFSINKKSKIDISITDIDVKILEIEKKDDNFYVLKGKYQKEIILIYIYQNFNYEVGDILQMKGNFTSPSEQKFQGAFDYKAYLNNDNIYYIFKCKSINYLKSEFTLNKIKYIVMKFYQNRLEENSFKYIKLLVFSYSDSATVDTTNYAKELYILHIFAISGFHILYLHKIFKYILSKIFYKDDLISFLSLFVIALYIIIIGSPISAMRAFLMLFLNNLFKKLDLKYTKLDIISIVFILIIIINPKNIYKSSFQFSFIISYMLIIFSGNIKKSKISNNLLVPLLSCLITFPLTINQNFSYNFLSLIISPFLLIIFTYLILPICYILMLFPFLSPILDFVFLFYDQLMIALGNIEILNVNFGYISFNYIFIYYIITFILLFQLSKNRFKKRWFFLLIFYLIFLLNINYLDPISHIYFIDVGQGDSTLIKLAHNKGTILIDTYNNIEFLKSKKIDTIDYLILTHSHDDHIGSLNEILHNFNVKNIIISKFDHYDYLNKEYYNFQTVVSGDSIYINSLKIEVLGPINENKNINNISIVLRFELENYIFLFTGDMEADEEKELISKYNEYLKSDFLKVSHHGSNTSSSNLFLNNVKPDYAIISVGLNNSYNLPSIETIDRLKKYKVYMTSLNKTIIISIWKNELYISTKK